MGGQYIICLLAESGTTKWQYRYDWPYDPAGVYPGPRSTPTYDDGFVYFTSPSGLIGCLDAESGNLIWSIELEKAFNVKVPGFGYSCSPIVEGDKIILPVGGRDASMVALDKRTGKIIWKAVDSKPTDGSPVSKKLESTASYSSAYPISFQGRKCVVGYLQNIIVCHDSQTGQLIWRYGLSSGYDEHSAWPIYDEPFLWITGPFQRGSELLEITGDINQPIRTARTSKLMSNDIFSSVLFDGALFGFDLQETQAKTHRTSRGIFRCIDFRSGQELWSVGNGRMQRSPAIVSDDSAIVSGKVHDELLIGHSTVVVADNKLILMNDLGELIVARASREKYEELCRTTLLGGEICWTQPAISRLRLFVRNHSRAVCVYLGLPDELAPQLRAKSISVSQIPQSKFLDLASVLLGIEPEYLFDLPRIDWLARWYFVSFLILVGSFAVAHLSAGLIQFAMRIVIDRDVIQHRSSSSLATWVFWILAFVFGAIGTTALSNWAQEFIFTWHVCLYVAWHIAISNVSDRTSTRNRLQRVQSLSAAIFLAVTCLVYFLLCRRLSLVFEWVFLIGFFGALPFNLASEKLFTQRRWTSIWQIVMTGIGFSAYFWTSVAILFLRSGG